MSVPTELVPAVLAALSPAELTINGRRVCKAAAAHFDAPRHRTLHFTRALDTPLLQQAAREMLRDALPHMTFAQKLSLMAAAAASGCEANLEIAWEALEPCLFPPHTVDDADPDRAEPLPYRSSGEGVPYTDPVFAALTRAPAERVAPTLAWLLRRCPLLLLPGGREALLPAVAAAAQCDVGRLQAAAEACGQWEAAVRGMLGSGGADATLRLAGPWWLDRHVVVAAAGSASADSVAKVQWAVRGLHRLEVPWGKVAEAAAGAGDRGLLVWLREQRDVEVGTEGALWAALRQGDLATAQWLVEVAGAPVEAVGLCEAAAGSCKEAVEKLAWLAGRGLRPRGAPEVVAAAAAGQVDTVRCLHEEWGAGLGAEAWLAAAGSGSVAMAAYLRDRGCPTWDGEMTLNEGEAYLRAAAGGHVAMVVWLAAEARCGRGEVELGEVIARWRTEAGNSVWAGWGRSGGRSSRTVNTDVSGNGSAAAGGCEGGYGDTELLAAVQVLVAAGWPLHRPGVADEAAGEQEDAGLDLHLPWGDGAGEGGGHGEGDQAAALALPWGEGEGGAGAGVGRPPSAAEAAARRGNLPVVRWLHEQEEKEEEALRRQREQQEQLEQQEQQRKQKWGWWWRPRRGGSSERRGVVWGREVLTAAAESGCQALAAWLWGRGVVWRGCGLHLQEAVRGAVARGDWGTLRGLVDSGAAEAGGGAAWLEGFEAKVRQGASPKDLAQCYCCLAEWEWEVGPDDDQHGVWHAEGEEEEDEQQQVQAGGEGLAEADTEALQQAAAVEAERRRQRREFVAECQARWRRQQGEGREQRLRPEQEWEREWERMKERERALERRSALDLQLALCVGYGVCLGLVAWAECRRLAAHR